MANLVEVFGATPAGVAAAAPVALVSSKPQHDWLKPTAPEMAGAAAGAFAGFKMWKHHKWLGLFTGLAVGDAAYPLATGKGAKGRQLAATQTVAAAGSVLGAKAWKKHPVLGWLLGGLAGSFAGSKFIPRDL